MDGLYIDGHRPKSKKAVKEAIAADQDGHTRSFPIVYVESTSMFGGYSGYAIDIPTDIHFVGPDPYSNRKFYGTLTRDKNGKVVVR